MERTISANELIAIELVKAWSLQPTTATQCFKFEYIMENYKKALKDLDEMDSKKKKDDSSIKLISDAVSYMNNVSELGRM
jgi:hypothetical protein